MGLTGVLVCTAMGAALLKVTNDPIVGNQFLFHSPREQLALDWVDRHIAGREVWVDTWPHQLDVMWFRHGYNWQPANNYRYWTAGDADSEQLSHVLLTDLTVLQAVRSQQPLPSVADRNLVYDNGDAQLYHRRQRTPFQK